MSPWNNFVRNVNFRVRQRINSLAPGRCDVDFKSAIAENMLRIKIMSAAWEIAQFVKSGKCHRIPLMGSQNWFR